MKKRLAELKVLMEAFATIIKHLLEQENTDMERIGEFVGMFEAYRKEYLQLLLNLKSIEND